MIRALFLLTATVVLTLPGSVSAQHTSIRLTDGGVTTWTFSDDDGGFEFEAVGEIVFLDDESGIESISEGGRFRMSIREGRTEMELSMKPAGNGRLEQTFRVNGREATFDQAARQRFAAVFPQIIRETGIGAEARVGKWLASGGVNAVFDGIRAIHSSRSSQTHLEALMDQADLKGADLRRVAEVLSADVRSSGDRSRFLADHAGAFLADDTGRAAFFAAADDIPSSSDRARLLLHVLEVDTGRTHYEDLFRVAAAIPSSSDKARVLMAAAPWYLGTTTHRQAYFDAVDAVSSSSNRAQVLQALLENASLHEATLIALLDSASRIPSSSSAAGVLTKASPFITTDRLVGAYMEAVDSIGSGTERSRALVALVEASR